MAEQGNKLNTELKEVALQLPASAQDIAQLEVGSIVYLSGICLLYTSPSPRDQRGSRMPSSA